MHKLKQYWVKQPRYAWIVIAGIAALAIAAVFFLWPKSADYQMATDTLLLKKQVDKLTDSLGKTTPSGKVIENYLSDLAVIETRCARIQANSTKATESQAAAVIARTSRLCKELSTLASTAKEQYLTVRGVLKIDSNTKRYMTLPGIQSLIRAAHEQTIAKAEERTRSLPAPTDTFPFKFHELTTRLKDSVTQSKGLSYMPTLRQYQQQILAQRVQYWSAYADSGALSAELTSQLKVYCHDLDLSPDNKVCRASEE